MGKSVFEEIDTFKEYERLKQEIEANYMSIRLVCLEAGVHQSTVSGWSNKKKPSVAKLNALKAAYKRLIDKRDRRKK